jgi:hypothetical protein
MRLPAKHTIQQLFSGKIQNKKDKMASNRFKTGKVNDEEEEEDNVDDEEEYLNKLKKYQDELRKKCKFFFCCFTIIILKIKLKSLLLYKII